MFGFVRRSFNTVKHVLGRLRRQALVKDPEANFLLHDEVNFYKRVHSDSPIPKNIDAG